MELLLETVSTGKELLYKLCFTVIFHANDKKNNPVGTASSPVYEIGEVIVQQDYKRDVILC